MTAIECKLKRDGGTFAEVGGVTYHFAENQDGAHVCDVDNDDHAQVFLSITEGYRFYKGSKSAPTLLDAEPVEEKLDAEPVAANPRKRKQSEEA